MKYVGSKNRLAKELVPIIQSYVDSPLCMGYIEPFVGGANIIDKIKCNNKIGYDNNKYLIALLKKVRDECEKIPNTYSELFYKSVKSNFENYEDWLIGLVGFSCFGAKWFGGFPRSFKEDGITPRDIVAESIRNLKKQSIHLQGITFVCKDFRNVSPVGCVIYCDPPYRGTTKYKGEDFPYEEFYEWCRKVSEHNIVLVSEYWMPEDFECIWQGEIKCTLDKNSRTDRTEKLFILNKEER